MSAGVFHNRVTLNDSSLLGGNPPFQPMVTVANGSADNPGGAGGGASDLPFGMQGQEIPFKHPTAYTWSAGVQREIPFGFVLDVTYVGRRGLYLQRERNINQLAEGTLTALPAGTNIAPYRPYLGLRGPAYRRELGAFALQQPAAQCRQALQQRLQDRRGLYARQVRGQRQRLAERAVEHLRRLQFLGRRRASTGDTC